MDKIFEKLWLAEPNQWQLTYSELIDLSFTVGNSPSDIVYTSGDMKLTRYVAEGLATSYREQFNGFKLRVEYMKENHPTP